MKDYDVITLSQLTRTVSITHYCENNIARSLLLHITRTATRSCRTRKRTFHFYSPGVVRWPAATAAAAAASALLLPVLLCIDNLNIKN